MRLDDAYRQLAVIQAQALRSELYRGFRAAPTAATGALAVAVAAWQTTLAPPASAADFAWLWVVTAVVAASLCALDLALRMRRHTRDERRRATLALGQLLPPVLAGAVLTFVLLPMGGPVLGLLPSLWATCFGLALLAARPYLPPAIAAVAAFYLFAGAVLLLPGLRAPLPPPLGMGLTFGIGQVWLALLLRRRSPAPAMALTELDHGR